MSFIWKYISETFSDSLFWLGLSGKEAKIMLLGLDNAGKTTLMYRLRHGRLHSANPTRYPQKDTMQICGITMTAYDLGGHSAAQKLWKEYMNSGIDAVVYLVDVADQKRMDESKKALHKLLSYMPPECPVLVLGNKIDISSVSESQCKILLGMEMMATGKVNAKPAGSVRPMEIFMCSIVKEAGYTDGFQWLSRLL
mmetsp:Transcript_33851/g.47226  ORF Transcript_33851/g.47226 Transcript_33851/m.47226 type:complete len:196 (-) Transcript_33851:246-833(-)